MTGIEERILKATNAVAALGVVPTKYVVGRNEYLILRFSTWAKFVAAGRTVLPPNDDLMFWGARGPIHITTWGPRP